MTTDIDDLVISMREGTLSRALWTHEAHLLVGLWHVRTLGLAGALNDMPALIRRYNEASGVANTDTSGYHETLTVAYLREIARQLASLPSSIELADAAVVVVNSDLADSNWPHRFWSRARLWSPDARRYWVEPDLQPLPA